MIFNWNKLKQMQNMTIYIGTDIYIYMYIWYILTLCICLCIFDMHHIHIFSNYKLILNVYDIYFLLQYIDILFDFDAIVLSDCILYCIYYIINVFCTCLLVYIYIMLCNYVHMSPRESTYITYIINFHVLPLVYPIVYNIPIQ